MSIKISAIEYFLPSKIVDNQFLVESLGFDIKFIENKLGISERRHAGTEESCATLANEAVKKLIDKNNISPIFGFVEAQEARKPPIYSRSYGKNSWLNQKFRIFLATGLCLEKQIGFK